MPFTRYEEEFVLAFLDDIKRTKIQPDFKRIAEALKVGPKQARRRWREFKINRLGEVGEGEEDNKDHEKQPAKDVKKPSPEGRRESKRRRMIQEPEPELEIVPARTRSPHNEPDEQIIKVEGSPSNSIPDIPNYDTKPIIIKVEPHQQGNVIDSMQQWIPNAVRYQSVDQDNDNESSEHWFADIDNDVA